MNQKNEINFLDLTVYINDQNSLEFRKFRKNSINTVIFNYEHSVMSKKYLKGGILTNLHRELDASSSMENFLKTLRELKEVYSRNSYPAALINSRIKIFLNNSEKPVRKATVHTICLEYSSPNIEHSICELTRKMSQLIPEFRVNVAYRSIKVSKLFSSFAKPVTDKFEKCDLVYEFLCPCDEIYIGQTSRMLIHRIREHQMPSSNKNICAHILCCSAYIENSEKFAIENAENFTSPLKAKLSNFKDKFKIIKKGFRYYKERERAEAFFIRTRQPSINDQFDHKAFKLF